MKHNASIIGNILAYYYSTSAIERVFLILNDSFGTQQNGTLQDYIEACLCSNTMTNRTIRAAVIIKCTMYTNVLIKNNKIWSWAVA